MTGVPATAPGADGGMDRSASVDGENVAAGGRGPAAASGSVAAGPVVGREVASSPPDPAVLDGPEAVTPAWLDAVLGTAGTAAGVRSVNFTPVGTGQMALTVRLEVDHADGTRRTLVAKFARSDVAPELSRMAYAKEVAFYRELATRVAIRTPACHHAAMADDAPLFVLVLEDVVGARQGDQIAGCSPVHARAAVENLAGLHGPTWCDPALAERPWLGGGDGVDPDLLRAFIAGAADAFAARFADDLGPEDDDVLAASREHLAEWALAPSERFSVIHGDYRLDNLLFPVDDPTRVAAVDWQTTAIGLPARDLAFFLATCLPVEERRRHEQRLLKAYHAALTRHGVAGYPFIRCVEDYRLGMMQAPLIILLGRATATETARGDEMFLAMWQRSTAAIHDAGTLDLL